GIRESGRNQQTQDLCATLDHSWQYLANGRNSGSMLCLEGVPGGTIDSHRGDRHDPGMVFFYFCSHAIAHWLMGRAVGIRFLFYTVGGTANPQGWPTGRRWIFERLPFLGVQTEKLSMQKASPRAKALMWSAGVTSSAITPTLGAFWAWRP